MAWPSVIHISFILTILVLKNSSGQQNGIPNEANTNTPLRSSVANNLNRMSTCPLHKKLLNGQICGNSQPSLNLQQQQLNLQQAALQQQFNLQQAANLQQASNFQNGVNIPQPNLGQMNVPPNLNQFNFPQAGNMQNIPQGGNMQNIPQHGNLQQLNLQPTGNVQQLNMQQTTSNLPIALQPNNFQQNLSPPLANLQLANNQVPDISFTSPMINSQFSATSPQINRRFPDIGMASQISPPMPCAFNPGAQTVPPMGFPSNQPFINPTAPFTPVADLGMINNQKYALVAVPIENQRSSNMVQPNIPNPMPGSPNQVTIIKSVQPQGYFDPMAPSSDFDKNKLSLLSSMLSDSAPNQFPPGSPLSGNSILGAALGPPKSGSKSSNLQALLPLIFNLLKEKNNGCTCHHCGRPNNKQEPQIFSGYANQNKNNYSDKTPSESSEDIEDVEESTESPETITEVPVEGKTVKDNTINSTDSRETEPDNDLDSYDDED